MKQVLMELTLQLYEWRITCMLSVINSVQLSTISLSFCNGDKGTGNIHTKFEYYYLYLVNQWWIERWFDWMEFICSNLPVGNNNNKKYYFSASWILKASLRSIFRVYHNSVNKKLNPIQLVHLLAKILFASSYCIEWLFRARLAPQSWTGLHTLPGCERVHIPFYYCISELEKSINYLG
jgi:hypothetical protein